MRIFKTKTKRLAGTRYREIYDDAFCIYEEIRHRTKRRPYLRSEYFKKQKVFLDVFWRHLHEKNWRDRARRLRFFPAAVEFIKRAVGSVPESKENPNDKNEILHRFTALTSDGHLFYIQIKEEKRSGNKSLLSVFPEKNQDTVLK